MLALFMQVNQDGMSKLPRAHRMLPWCAQASAAEVQPWLGLWLANDAELLQPGSHRLDRYVKHVGNGRHVLPGKPFAFHERRWHEHVTGKLIGDEFHLYFLPFGVAAPELLMQGRSVG